LTNDTTFLPVTPQNSLTVPSSVNQHKTPLNSGTETFRYPGGLVKPSGSTGLTPSKSFFGDVPLVDHSPCQVSSTVGEDVMESSEVTSSVSEVVSSSVMDYGEAKVMKSRHKGESSIRDAQKEPRRVKLITVETLSSNN